MITYCIVFQYNIHHITESRCKKGYSAGETLYPIVQNTLITLPHMRRL